MNSHFFLKHKLASLVFLLFTFFCLSSQAIYSVDKNYPWYRDQGGSGVHSLFNCGPAVTTMAMTWFNPYYQKFSTQQARQLIRPGGSWWKPADIKSLLDTYRIPNRYIPLNGSESVWKNELHKNRILIANLNMAQIPYKNSGWEGKFYSTFWPWWGHFLIIKGYTYANGKLYFQTYDSFSFGKRYTNGQPMGKDRYYPFNEVDHSTRGWFPYLISVGR